MLRRHILGLTKLDSPYKLLAADVNKSRTISSLDLALMRRMVLGMTNRLPAGIWRFVPADQVFPDPAEPWDALESRTVNPLSPNATAQDFLGIKLGDVNGSWTPAN